MPWLGSARSGGEATAIQTDVRNYEAVEAMVEGAVAAYGAVDVMMANAAGNFVVPSAEMSPNAWRTVVEIDSTAHFYCARAAYHALRNQVSGGG